MLNQGKELDDVFEEEVLQCAASSGERLLSSQIRVVCWFAHFNIPSVRDCSQVALNCDGNGWEI